MDNNKTESETILLVEDAEANRYLTSRLLRRAGYRVLEASTGAEALQVAKNRPDLIILDVNLPDISGLEVSQILRNNPATCSLPILQTSATFTLTTDKIKGLDAGADVYLASPIEPEELLAQVRTFLRLKHTQEDLQRRLTELEAAHREIAEVRDQLNLQNRLLETRVQERTARLEEIISDLETFSYSITHDLRAPLRAMHGFSKLLLERNAPQLDAMGADYLLRIANSAQRLDLLIRDVLTYSTIVRAELNMVPIDLQRLIEDLVREYPGLQPPNAEISLPPRLPVVLGVQAFLVQCFSNLLDNAVKFVPPNTIPRVIISMESPCTGWVRLKLKDNGIGIAPEHQRRLFKLFHRAQSQYPGTGVGLAVVRKAVERMGGRVGLESSPGQGCTFWVELKEAPPEPGSSPGSAAADG